ncbi:MAG: hypothetical protein WC648_05425 [Candidatus Paceibacterota bacterium]|jgi:hypothetical protein
MDYSKLTDAELDERAAKCMGWKKKDCPQYNGSWWVDAAGVFQPIVEDWCPSTVPADAFRFMEHALKERQAHENGWWEAQIVPLSYCGGTLWRCRVVMDGGEHMREAIAPTLSRAITEALVAAYEAEKGEQDEQS